MWSCKTIWSKGWVTLWVGASQGNLPSARFGSHKHCLIVELKEFVSLTMVAMEMEKRELIQVIIATVTKRKIYFIKNTNLLHSNYHWSNWVDWKSKRRQIMLQSQKGIFSLKGSKSYILWLPSITFLLKKKLGELQGWFSSFYRLEMLMYVRTHNY